MAGARDAVNQLPLPPHATATVGCTPIPTRLSTALLNHRRQNSLARTLIIIMASWSGRLAELEGSVKSPLVFRAFPDARGAANERVSRKAERPKMKHDMKLMKRSAYGGRDGLETGSRVSRGAYDGRLQSSSSTIKELQAGAATLSSLAGPRLRPRPPREIHLSSSRCDEGSRRRQRLAAFARK